MKTCLVVQPIHHAGLDLLLRNGIRPVPCPSADMATVASMLPGCDAVITRDAGLVRVDAVSRFTRRLAAVRFAAGTLGANRPDQDLILPAGQPVLVRDWRARALFGRSQAMVRAAALIDDEFITRLDARDMTLHQLHFARAHVIYAGGLELGCGDDLSLARAA